EPTITSGAVATAIDENSGAGQLVYTATSTDSADIATGSTTYRLTGTDAALFSIDPSSGADTLTDNPDFETQSSYSFTVVATDAANNASTKDVTLAVNYLDAIPPSVTLLPVSSSPILLEPTGATNGYDYNPQITALGSDGAFVVTWFGQNAGG